MTLASRLKALERDRREQEPVEIRVFWDGQLKLCPEHPDCDIEVATVEHLKGVIKLRW